MFRRKRQPEHPHLDTVHTCRQMLSALEEKTQNPWFCYWSAFGISLSEDDVLACNEMLLTMGRLPELNLLLKSQGGDGEAALRLTRLLRHVTDHLTVWIPLDCASAATMVAMCADEIRMSSIGYLSPVDTSLDHELSPVNAEHGRVSVSENSLQRARQMMLGEAEERDANPYVELFKHIHPLVVGEIDRAADFSLRVCREILMARGMDEETIHQMIQSLDTCYPAHSYPIGAQEARELGLPAQPMEREMEHMLWGLGKHYSERTHTRERETKSLKTRAKTLTILETSQRTLECRAQRKETYSRRSKSWRETMNQTYWYEPPNPTPLHLG